jgi:autotransporter passenger strand-loop-strand repeat protein
MTTYVVSSGQTSSGITLNSGDSEIVLSGGTAISTTINSGGLLTVSGGSASFDTISGGGLLIVSSGGSVSSDTIFNGGLLLVSSGGSASFDMISGGGLLSVLSGGSVSSDTIFNGGSLVLSGDSEDLINLNHGTATNETISSGGSLIVSAGGRARITTNNGGRETVFSGASGGAGTINSGGLLTVSAGGGHHDDTINGGGSATVLSGGAMAGVTINGPGAVLDLLSGAFLGGGVYVRGGANFISAAGGQLRIGGSEMPRSAISGFVSGDIFDLTSIAFDSRGSASLTSGNVLLSIWNDSIGDFELTSVTSDNVLQITEGGKTYDLNLDPGQNFTGAFFHLASDGSSGTLVTEDQNPCYCRGTLIRTETGEVPVEELAIGDKVATLSGMARPIKWIGRRSYSGRFTFGQTQILPVCITAGALDDGVPGRDLWVSPNHALYLEDVLIEARDLVNGVSIFQAERVAAIEYFHIELDSHEVIIAEAAYAESFIDNDSRGLFHNAHEYWALYADAAAGAARYCAPRREEGFEVERARARIARRAGLPVMVEVAALGLLRGQIDAVGRRVCGWAQDTAHPEAPVCLDIFAGGELIGQVAANRYRADLQRARLGSGRHSFEFFAPAGLTFVPGSVAVRRSLDGAALTHSDPLARRLARAADRAPGMPRKVAAG